MECLGTDVMLTSKLLCRVFIKPEGRTILVEAGRRIVDYPDLKEYEWCIIGADTPGKSIFGLNPISSYFKGGRRYKVPIEGEQH